MVDFLQKLGHKTLSRFAALGRATTMLFGALCSLPNFRKGTPLLIKQLYMVGHQSLLIIMVSGLFIGMVLALQGYTVLVGYGAEDSLGPLVALSLLRELICGNRTLICRTCRQCVNCRNRFDEGYGTII